MDEPVPLTQLCKTDNALHHNYKVWILSQSYGSIMLYHLYPALFNGKVKVNVATALLGLFSAHIIPPCDLIMYLQI